MKLLINKIHSLIKILISKTISCYGALQQLKKFLGVAQLVEMGCGKTLTAIAIAGNLYNSGKIKKLLVVCPLSIVDVWQSEFEKFADFDFDLSVLKGSTCKKIEALKRLQS